MSDPGSTYRTRDEISGVRQVNIILRLTRTFLLINTGISHIYLNMLSTFQERDPIERVRKLLLGHDISTEKELKVKMIID